MSDDAVLLEALRRGDEAAFVWLLDRYHAQLLRVALMHVSSWAVAEEVVQEAWLGVLQGLGRFEARSSLRTWIFRILLNRARTISLREGRALPFSTLGGFETEEAGAAVEPERFRPAAEPVRPRHWAILPRPWADGPADRLLAGEVRRLLRAAVQGLPMSQREVVTMRDLEGWPAAEVCELLGITDANQRVLLHRARSTVRRALERYFDERDG